MKHRVLSLWHHESDVLNNKSIVFMAILIVKDYIMYLTFVNGLALKFDT